MSQVTVLVPNYNGAVYLRECLESIVAQTFADWELVVGDNASTDASLSIVASMADRRIRTVRRPRTIWSVTCAGVSVVRMACDRVWLPIG